MVFERSILYQIGQQEIGCFQYKGVYQKCQNYLTQLETRILDRHVIDRDNGTEVPPFALDFCRVLGSEHLLAVADEDGAVLLYNTEKEGNLAFIKEWPAHSNACFDIAWLPKSNDLVTASGDRSLALWDGLTTKKIDSFTGHTSSVKSVGVSVDDSNIFVSGSRDGHVMVWDRRINKKDVGVCTVKNAHLAINNMSSKQRRRSKSVIDSQQSVTSVLFQDENSVISAGAEDGIVKIWDLRKLKQSSSKADSTARNSFDYAGKSLRNHGYTCLCLDQTRTRLFASCRDNCIYQFNCANYQNYPVAVYRGHKTSTFYVRTCLSPDDKYILTGSSDYNAYIYDIDDPFRSPVRLMGHSGEVTSVTWNRKDFFKILTLSDDCCMNIWRLSKQRGLGQPVSCEVVGTAEVSYREIGSNTCQKTSNPVHGRCVQLSSSSPTKNISSILPPQTEKFKHPNLRAWLENMTKRSCPSTSASPNKLMKCSPRKLIISPRKTVKRKLDENDENISPCAKRHKKTSPSCKSGSVLPLSENCSNSSSLVGVKRKLDVEQKRVSTFNSPCQNLPNSVEDNIKERSQNKKPKKLQYDLKNGRFVKQGDEENIVVGPTLKITTTPKGKIRPESPSGKKSPAPGVKNRQTLYNYFTVKTKEVTNDS